jgi:hypothetical protein
LVCAASFLPGNNLETSVVEPCAAQVERDDMIKLDILHAALRWWRAGA